MCRRRAEVVYSRFLLGQCVSAALLQTAMVALGYIKA